MKIRDIFIIISLATTFSGCFSSYSYNILPPKEIDLKSKQVLKRVHLNSTDSDPKVFITSLKSFLSKNLKKAFWIYENSVTAYYGRTVWFEIKDEYVVVKLSIFSVQKNRDRDLNIDELTISGQNGSRSYTIELPFSYKKNKNGYIATIENSDKIIVEDSFNLEENKVADFTVVSTPLEDFRRDIDEFFVYLSKS